LTCLECHSPGPAPSEIISVLSANFTETGGGPNGDVVVTAKNVDASQVSVSYNGGAAQPMNDNAGTWKYTFTNQSYTDVATDYVTLTSVGLGNTTAQVVDLTDYARGAFGPQTDAFTGLSTGQAAGLQTSNWTEATDAGDSTTQWMVWNGPTDTATYGPSAGEGGSGEYLVLESSIFTDPGGPVAVTIEDAWSNVGTGSTLAYSTQASAELLVVAVGIESNGTASAVTGVTYAGSSLTQETVSSATGITMWVGSLDISAVSDSGNIVVTASNASEIHVHAITFSGADMAGTPVTALSATSANNKATSINVPTMTYTDGDQVVTVGHKAAFTIQYTGVSDEDVNYSDGTLLAGSIGASIHSTRGVTTAGTNDGVTDPVITYEQTAGGGGNKSWMSVAGIVVNAAAGGGGEFDGTNGDDTFTGAAPQYIETGIDVSIATGSALHLNFDYNLNVNDNTDAELHVDYWNGTWNSVTGNIWDQVPSDTWRASGDIDLSSYTDATKVRIRYVVGTGTLYHNDIGLDNIVLSASAEPSTLETITITSANWDDPSAGDLTVNATGPASMWADYGADAANALTGGTLTFTPTDGEYLANVRVYSVQGEDSFTPVGNAPAGGSVYHPAKDHSASINTTANCTTTCHHTATGNAIVTGTHSDTCATCHAAAAPEVITAIYEGFDGTSTPACTTCHERTGKLYDSEFSTAHDSNGSATDHTDNIATTPLCATTCHNGADLIVNVHNNNCVNCHTNTAGDGSLHDGTTSGSVDSTNSHGNAKTGHVLGGSRTCAQCHTGYFDGHTKTHTMAEPTLCTSCHLAGTAPFVAGDDDATYDIATDDVHDVNGCGTCHDTATDGSLKVGSSAEGAIGGESCQDCHSGYFDGHGHDHSATGTNSVLGPIDTSTFTKNCLSCHIAGTAPFIAGDDSSDYKFASDDVHDASNCSTCHDTAVDGDLITGSNGDANANSGNGGDCAVCHTAFSLHSYDTSHSIGVWGDTSGGILCSTGAGCHANDTGTWQKIKDRHDLAATPADVCLVCHDSTRNDPDGNVQAVIQLSAAQTSCLDCHVTKSAVHGVHTEGDGTLGVVTVAPNDTPCGGCHATASGSSAPKGDVTAGIHSDNCSLCHAGGVAGADPPAGIIVDDAATVWNGSAWLTANQPHDCVECHVDYFGDNTGGHTHVHQLTTATGCVDCHANVAGTNARDAIATPFVDSGQVHDTLQCATCHDTAVDGALKGSAVGATATADCVGCHITIASKTWTEIHTAALGTVQPAVDHSHANSTVSTSVVIVMTMELELMRVMQCQHLRHGLLLVKYMKPVARPAIPAITTAASVVV
jgi:hypothetical protein